MIVEFDPLAEEREQMLEEQEFQDWMAEVDNYSQRFFSMSLYEFLESTDMSHEMYEEGYKTMAFVKICLIQELECDFGCDFVEELVFDNILLGNGTL